VRLIRLRRYAKGTYEEVEDWVAEEGLVVLRLDGAQARRFVITPEKIREFVYGYLLGAGLIGDPSQVVSYREELHPEIGIPGEVVEVKVSLSAPPGPLTSEVVWAACDADVSEEAVGFKRLSPQPLIPERKLIEIPKLTAENSEDFKLTGAYHYAFLFDPELKLLASAKDISRHNAVDKAIGQAFLAGTTFKEAILYITGRVTAAIVLKALRAGIPVVASRGAALLGAVHLARRFDLCLIGFLRAERFNLYWDGGWLIR